MSRSAGMAKLPIRDFLCATKPGQVEGFSVARVAFPPTKVGYCNTVDWGVWRRVSRFRQGYIKGMVKGITKCVPYSCTLELLEVNRRPFGNRNARKKAHTKPIEKFHLHCVAGKAQQISNFVTLRPHEAERREDGQLLPGAVYCEPLQVVSPGDFRGNPVTISCSG